MGDEFDEVLAAAQAGAEWAWSLLYGDLAGALLGYLRIQGAHEPEDLLGEVFLQLARNVGSFRGDRAAFRSWCFTIAHHRVIDERRRRRRHPVDPVDPVEEMADLPAAVWDQTASEALNRVDTERLRRMLEGLAPAQRDILLLRLIGGFTIAEIAASTGRSVGAVKALQRRGLEALAARLGDWGVSP